MSPWSINVMYLLINFAHKPTENHPITVEWRLPNGESSEMFKNINAGETGQFQLKKKTLCCQLLKFVSG